MRLTRHAKNRLRWIRRSAPDLTDDVVIDAISAGRQEGLDSRGNRRVTIAIGSVSLTVVVDDGSDVIVTVWRET